MDATTVRILPRQKRKLVSATAILAKRLGRRLSQGEAVEALADAALRRPELLDEASEELSSAMSDDPLFDPKRLVWRMGRTDARTLDSVTYGDR